VLVLGSASALFPLREHRELQVLRLPNCICILSMECTRISQSVLKLLGMRPCLEPYLWQKCRLILSVESGRAIDSTVFHDGICKQHDSSPLCICEDLRPSLSRRHYILCFRPFRRQSFLHGTSARGAISIFEWPWWTRDAINGRAIVRHDEQDLSPLESALRHYGMTL
jgi:hypothetical protein